MPEQFSAQHLSSVGFLEKISNAAQVGGIETSVIDNGLGRGTRIAWINTGAGFRYKLVLDRAMDIADAWFNQYSLGWMSSVGTAAPQPFSDKGTEWLRSFSGMLATCGLSHVGGPEKDEYGERGLHGTIRDAAAEIERIKQPDPFSGEYEMSITARINEVKVFGPHLELRRTISSTLGKASLRIEDEVLNRGNTAAPHMLLYHFNFGWPLADEGARLYIDGDYNHVIPARDKKFFNSGNDFKTVPAPLEEHRGTGEACAYFDMKSDDQGNCKCGLFNPRIGVGVALQFNKRELPWLTNWQHWGPREYVTGIEPCTNPPIGQAQARKEGTLIFLEPGEKRTYTLELQIVTNAAELQE